MFLFCFVLFFFFSFNSRFLHSGTVTGNNSILTKIISYALLSWGGSETIWFLSCYVCMLIIDRLRKKPGGRGRGRGRATLGVHPLSWLLSNNRLEKVPFLSVPHTSSNRLLLSNQDKGCTPSVAHSLALPLGPALINLWTLCGITFLYEFHNSSEKYVPMSRPKMKSYRKHIWILTLCQKPVLTNFDLDRLSKVWS